MNLPKVDLLDEIRRQNPIVHCITNYVTARDVANLLLTAGASPIMADHEGEAKEIAALSQAMVMNLGTFKDSSLAAMKRAGKTAARLGHPMVLDPVGVGASPLRMEAAVQLLEEIPCTAIRGNVSEITALAKRILDENRLLNPDSPSMPREKGVDADLSQCLKEQQLAFKQAGRLARAAGCLVVMTGPKDLITDGRAFLLVENGHPMMSRITGSGCMLDGILAAALAAALPALLSGKPANSLAVRLSLLLPAAAYAVSAMGICGQLAAEKTLLAGGGTGSFHMHFMDAMSLLTDEQVRQMARIRELPSKDILPAPAKPEFDLRLYAVTDRAWTGKKTLLEQLEEALQSGVTLVQLREKELDDTAFLEEARKVKELTDRYHVPLIINDHIGVALNCGAAGVHLGQEDLDPREARQLLGPDRIIGVTAKTVAQARRAQMARADYLGSGAIFGSQTKKEAIPMTTELLKEIASSVSIPVVAIGGINGDNISRLEGTGIAGAAVVSGIFAAGDIPSAARKLRQAIDQITGQPSSQDSKGGLHHEA